MPPTSCQPPPAHPHPRQSSQASKFPLYQVPSWQPGHWCGNVEPILGEGSAPIIPALVHALPPSVVFGLCGEIVEAGADKANHNLVPSLSVQLDPIQHRKYKKDENVGQIYRCTYLFWSKNQKSTRICRQKCANNAFCSKFPGQSCCRVGLRIGHNFQGTCTQLATLRISNTLLSFS